MLKKKKRRSLDSLYCVSLYFQSLSPSGRRKSSPHPHLQTLGFDIWIQLLTGVKKVRYKLLLGWALHQNKRPFKEGTGICRPETFPRYSG